ncbi:uncharacterized protein VTP21DRAFT_4532 [Calcarisporiella thermophila]|uniref:uncharacterized protein n=1 Tax=Calcarisporiella thermophila TaxID=911321 RepID=UPI003742945F
MGEALFFAFSTVLSLLLLSIKIFFFMMIADLETDYVNPIDCSRRLNKAVLPEAGIQAFFAFASLVTGHWFTFLMNLPLVAWNAKKIKENKHLFDATEVFRQLGRHKKELYIKIGLYVVLFFYSLFRMLFSIAATNRPDNIYYPLM